VKHAIEVSHVSKKFRIGSRAPYHRFSELMVGAAKAPVRGLRRLAGDGGAAAPAVSEPTPEREFWALKDVSFTVEPGEVLGIIGRNGAGKSTLLKIISRITDPDAGLIRMRGRVSSLLEVGTGFHPELTGRENIFLNGAILGMSRREIRGKFDAIVDFAGTERFLHTPVKHYSSGMYTRLAFAVAAHLDPEILLVDEVLSVGDIEFQEKCLGKMRDVAGQGRTVLFVSHKMSAIANLCQRVQIIDAGRIIFDGEPNDGISRYQHRMFENTGDAGRLPIRAAGGDFELRAVEAALLPAGSYHDLRLRVHVWSRHVRRAVRLGLQVWTPDGMKVFSQGPKVTGIMQDHLEGEAVFEVDCPAIERHLASGVYHLTVILAQNQRDHLIREDQVCQFRVPETDRFGTGAPFTQRHGIAPLPFRLVSTRAGAER